MLPLWSQANKSQHSLTSDRIGQKDIEAAKSELKEWDPIINVIPYQIADKMLEADRYTAVANYYAAEALLARILLDEGKYEDAKTTALDVINSGKFHLVDAEKASMYLLTLSIISLLTSKFLLSATRAYTIIPKTFT